MLEDAKNKPDASWREIASQALVETDPVKLAELCQKLNEVMVAEERKKVGQRFVVQNDNSE